MSTIENNKISPVFENANKTNSGVVQSEAATTTTSHLFTPLTLRGITFPNRIMVSPMCQYSSVEGFASDWHLVHLGSRAVGGAGTVFTEAIAVEARGRISPQDLGIYRDEHLEMLCRITDFIKAQGAVPGTQLAHAGRKASTRRPWESAKGATVTPAEGGWTPIAPSAVAFNEVYPMPTAMSQTEIAEVVRAFGEAARRAKQAGFQVIELHAAHGYLLHQFLSPVANQRSDKYGGSLENRQRIVLEAVEAIRQEWPDELPLFVRVSATDWLSGIVENSWELSDTIQLVKNLRQQGGVDLIDVSSGGISPQQKITVGPGYQVPFAEAIRQETGVPVAAVGMITQPAQADDIISSGQADLVALARELLRDPYWSLHAARQLGYKDLAWPVQYARAKD